MLEPYPLPVGYVYEPRPVAIERAQQMAKLAASGIDAEVHGGRLDLTFLGLPILDALMEPGVPLQGQVHVYQRFIQQAPIYLDTELEMRGEITAIEQVAKGEVVRWSFAFTDRSGRALVSVDRAGLRPRAGGGGNSGATDFLAPPAEDDRAGFEEIWRRTLVPEQVAAYSSDGKIGKPSPSARAMSSK